MKNEPKRSEAERCCNLLNSLIAISTQKNDQSINSKIGPTYLWIAVLCELQMGLFLKHLYSKQVVRNKENYKNSSGDEIANVNFLRRYRTYVLQNTKKDPTSFNQLDDSTVLRIQSWIYEYATVHLAVIEYLYRGRRAVSLQTFTTRHSNRKWSIVMALSTTFTQYAPKISKFLKNHAK